MSSGAHSLHTPELQVPIGRDVEVHALRSGSVRHGVTFSSVPHTVGVRSVHTSVSGQMPPFSQYTRRDSKQPASNAASAIASPGFAGVRSNATGGAEIAIERMTSLSPTARALC